MRKALVEGLTITMFIGAAREEAARLGKFEQLKQAILPVTAQFRKDGRAKPLIESCLSVLGEDWRPEGEWAAYIDTLLQSEVETDGE